MSNQRKGFTIIEVSLVLAISGLLLVGIMSGVTGSVARQRYNDSVQSIAEEFRTIYSQVNNPQGIDESGGTSDQAIYGKLAIIHATDAGDTAQIDTYTVIGSADRNLAARTSGAIDDTFRALTPAVTDHNVYTAPWGAVLQRDDSNVYQGSLLIIHSPNGGAVHTYASDLIPSGSDPDFNNDEYLSSFSQPDVNLCVDSPDLYAAGGIRRNIRIVSDGRNASAIQLIDVNSGPEDGGNICGT